MAPGGPLRLHSTLALSLHFGRHSCAPTCCCAVTNKTGLVWLELNALLCAYLRRSRASRTMPPHIGCSLLGSPRTSMDDRLRKYSRPGPKSGVGSNLVIALVLLQSQLSRSVRVPALSVGAGEGNPPTHFCKHPVPKPNGIQVTYGKQEPTHNWNRYVKRSFKRACHRAIKHGQANYKGRTLTVTNSSSNQPPTTFSTVPKPPPTAGLLPQCGRPRIRNVRGPHGIPRSITL